MFHNKWNVPHAIATTSTTDPTTAQTNKKSTKHLGFAKDMVKERHIVLQQPLGCVNSKWCSRLTDLDLVQEYIDQRLKRETTNFRQVLEMDFKLTITLRHLATRESYKSLGCHWREGELLYVNSFLMFSGLRATITITKTSFFTGSTSRG